MTVSNLSRLGPYSLGPNNMPENGIYTGDSRELARSIPDDSIDLIFCDPIYQRVDDYRWLAETAMRVLKPNSACLVWCSKPLAAQCQIAMEEAGLDYVYTLDYVVQAKSYRLMYYHIFLWTTPCLWMQKGHSVPRFWIPDTFISSQRPKGKHRWNKNPGVTIKWIDAFCEPGSVVFDPFTGGGVVPASAKMLERNYIAFEICPETAALARERVRNTQPPLPGFTVEQPSFVILDEHVKWRHYQVEATGSDVPPPPPGEVGL